MNSMEKITEYVSALSTLLKTTPIEKIRVKDICELCGTDRQNFYHYFKDKYDLASWIYRLDYIESVRNNSNSFNKKQLVELVERIRSKPDIYINLFTDASQNSLYSFVIESECEIFLQIKKEKTGIDELNSKERCIAVFAFAGFLDVLVACLRGEYSFSARQLADLTYLMTNDYLLDQYKHYEFKNFPEK